MYLQGVSILQRLWAAAYGSSISIFAGIIEYENYSSLMHVIGDDDII